MSNDSTNLNQNVDPTLGGSSLFDDKSGRRFNATQGFLVAIFAVLFICTCFTIKRRIRLPGRRGSQESEPDDGLTSEERRKRRSDEIERGLLTKKWDAKSDDENVCSICLNEYTSKDMVAYSNHELCSHVFHKKCIASWLMKHKDCPLCRHTFLEKDQNEQENDVEANIVEQNVTEESDSNATLTAHTDRNHWSNDPGQNEESSLNSNHEEDETVSTISGPDGRNETVETPEPEESRKAETEEVE